MSLIHCSVSDVLHNCYDPAAVTTRGQGYKKGVVTTWALFSVLAVTHIRRVRATTLSVISEFW